MAKYIWSKTYSGESLYDLHRDIAEAFDSDFNNSMQHVQKDKYGFLKGEFTVTITHEEASE